jgi:hypothetical protein
MSSQQERADVAVARLIDLNQLVPSQSTQTFTLKCRDFPISVELEPHQLQHIGVPCFTYIDHHYNNGVKQVLQYLETFKDQLDDMPEWTFFDQKQPQVDTEFFKSMTKENLLNSILAANAMQCMIYSNRASVYFAHIIAELSMK